MPAEPAFLFLRDLALILGTAALATVLFQRLRFPIIVGYLVAGVLVRPLIHNPDTIRTLAELGVVLLLFSIGLEFRLRRLAGLGPRVALAMMVEVGIDAVARVRCGSAPGTRYPVQPGRRRNGGDLQHDDRGRDDERGPRGAPASGHRAGGERDGRPRGGAAHRGADHGNGGRRGHRPSPRAASWPIVPVPGALPRGGDAPGAPGDPVCHPVPAQRYDPDRGDRGGPGFSGGESSRGLFHGPGRFPGWRAGGGIGTASLRVPNGAAGSGPLRRRVLRGGRHALRPGGDVRQRLDRGPGAGRPGAGRENRRRFGGGVSGGIRDSRSPSRRDHPGANRGVLLRHCRSRRGRGIGGDRPALSHRGRGGHDHRLRHALAGAVGRSPRQLG